MKNTVKFMFSKMLINMEQIIRKDGKVFLVESNSVDGKHTTWQYLGIDPESIEINEEKPKKKRKKSEE